MKLDDADAVYVGANSADAVYLGNALVWSAWPPEWRNYYPQAIQFASIIDQAINEEWPQ